MTITNLFGLAYTRSCVRWDDWKLAAASASEQRLQSSAIWCHSRPAQHSQLPYRPGCSHRRPRLWDLPGEVLPCCRPQVLSVELRQIQTFGWTRGMWSVYLNAAKFYSDYSIWIISLFLNAYNFFLIIIHIRKIVVSVWWCWNQWLWILLFLFFYYFLFSFFFGGVVKLFPLLICYIFSVIYVLCFYLKHYFTPSYSVNFRCWTGNVAATKKKWLFWWADPSQFCTYCPHHCKWFFFHQI